MMLNYARAASTLCPSRPPDFNGMIGHFILPPIIHLLGQAPEGFLAAPDTARMRGRAWSSIEPRHTIRSFAPRGDGLSVVLPEE
jgi:hypothetical protein